jgi:polyisoprenoid-binding protein YceI
MTTTSGTQTYAIDPAHSTAEFVVRHLMIAKVRGRFTAVAGTIEVPAGSTVPTAVHATLETSSITTGEPQRDAHLKSADFFDAEKYTQIVFDSTDIVPDGEGFVLHGRLTISGETHPVELKTSYEGETIDPWGNKRLGFEAHGKISRKQFGLTWNQALEAGGVAVGDEVKIELSIEGVAQK